MSQSVIYRADLHVHSRCSGNPANPGIRALRSRESYSDPLQVYAAAKARGMDFVTITDHNTLDGSLAIAHLTGTFLGCEFDTWFPDDGVRVHVVALGIDEVTFAAADQARASIYDLVACLREAGTTHFLAHPLFDMTGKLTPDHVEKLLLLFNTIEGLNGARTDRCNGLFQEIARGLTAEKLFAMAERQGLEPLGERPWQKALTGGSDDHSGLFIAGAHTVAGGDGTPAGFLRSVAAGECRPAGEHGDARLLAHSIYTASFHRIREIARLDEEVPHPRYSRWMKQGFGELGPNTSLLEKAVHGVRKLAPGLYEAGDGRGERWEELLDEQIGNLLATAEGLLALGSDELNRRFFSVAQRLADDVVSFHLQLLLRADRKLRLGEKFGSGFAVGMVHFLEIPYFIAWFVQSRDRASQLELRRHFLEELAPPARLAVFGDVGGDGAPDGPLARALRAAGETRGVGVEFITITPEATSQDGEVTNFRVLAWRRGADGRGVAVPSGIELLDHLEQERCTAIHVTSTGAAGIAGVLAAKLLHLPVTGLADLRQQPLPVSAAKGRGRHRVPGLLLYKMLDVVLVPSREAALLLSANGVDPGRIRILPETTPADGLRGYVGEVLKGVRLRPPRPADRTATRAKVRRRRPVLRGAPT